MKKLIDPGSDCTPAWLSLAASRASEHAMAGLHFHALSNPLLLSLLVD
jgi:hypothetical protein